MVTGSSAGIGLACARELASRDFDIILLGHKEHELEEARRQVLARRADVQVKTVIINCVTATAEDIHRALQPIYNLEITVLVNNVGGLVPVQPSGFKPIWRYTAEEIDATINLNLRFMAHLTRLLMPILIQNSPALIISISSQARFGCPYTAVYSGAKAFVASLSNAVNRENTLDGVDVSAIAVISGEVRSQANSRPATGMIECDVFARELFNKAPAAAALGTMEITVHWKHRLTGSLLRALPEWLLARMIVKNLHRGDPG
ncbi:hypothetical protein JDV02_007221 [Purpureocillium takamizusanense]|uniref:Uncharacterized protein n=1 Tax=Purpureocillium takamizusanense TaxID=2060973 RepID=A0A9Q8QM00_9HYPO|nr:uncharacterized protein JDV02_007221 [Purpureocillium takamizusanense]UNI21211.1 hypothetical protein JDV02_007221 [Purpureocillium takamizusanense]